MSTQILCRLKHPIIALTSIVNKNNPVIQFYFHEVLQLFSKANEDTLLYAIIDIGESIEERREGEL